MASETVFDAIRAFVEAEWSATAAVKWENEGFWRRTVADPDVWEQFSTEAPTNAPWVLIELQGTLYAQVSIGESNQADNRWDEEGVVYVHVNVPKGTGSRDARVAAFAAANLFRGVTLVSGSLEFMDASIGVGESVEEGNFYRLTVTIDWRRMEP